MKTITRNALMACSGWKSSAMIPPGPPSGEVEIVADAHVERIHERSERERSD